MERRWQGAQSKDLILLQSGLRPRCYTLLAMPEAFYVYILASNNRRTLYIGVTNSLSMRLR